LTNGEIVTVTAVDDRGRIHLEDGRVLPSNFKQFTHGYAVTAHRSQGKSVDAVIISGDDMQKELFYVAASRGRERVQVIMSDKERLRDSIGCFTARKSASELARSVHRSRRVGRDFGTRAAQEESLFEAQPFVRSVIEKPKVERSYDRGISR
jgi:ATP-dependent exoDNAse (exonuclease V) alpha subunit